MSDGAGWSNCAGCDAQASVRRGRRREKAGYGGSRYRRGSGQGPSSWGQRRHLKRDDATKHIQMKMWAAREAAYTRARAGSGVYSVGCEGPGRWKESRGRDGRWHFRRYARRPGGHIGARHAPARPHAPYPHLRNHRRARHGSLSTLRCDSRRCQCGAMRTGAAGSPGCPPSPQQAFRHLTRLGKRRLGALRVALHAQFDIHSPWRRAREPSVPAQIAGTRASRSGPCDAAPAASVGISRCAIAVSEPTVPPPAD